MARVRFRVTEPPPSNFTYELSFFAWAVPVTRHSRAAKPASHHIPSSLPCTLKTSEESDVLEIGFGCGYSADRIQEFSPRSHTIIEPDPVVLARLGDWAAARPGNVVVVEGFWQTALAKLGKYDAIFFDDFPVSE